MYRITKVLNHNTVLAVKDKSAREYLIVGKGVGFGKKITQSVEPTDADSLYELTQTRDRGPAKDIVKSSGRLNNKSLRFRKGLIIGFRAVFSFSHQASVKNQPPKSEELSLTSIAVPSVKLTEYA